MVRALPVHDRAADPIHEELKHGGVRLRTVARMAGARIPVTIDIGFGDSIEPGFEEVDLPIDASRPGGL